jgi:O-methyltransferase
MTTNVARRRPVETWPGTLSRIQGVMVNDSSVKIVFCLIEETRHVEGSIAECGVYRGGSLLALGLYIEQHGLERSVFGFDSFEGFDATVATDIALGGPDPKNHRRIGGFSDTSLESVQKRIKALGLAETVKLVPGYFNETLPNFGDTNFSFVHLDCDLYQSYMDCMTFFYPRMPSGAVVLFDEYDDPVYPGCKLAIDEFLAGRPEKPVPIQIDRYEKWFVRKV